MTTMLSLRGLSLGYNHEAVVRDLKAEIATGSMTAIVGPNGAGKSTLLKGIAGQLSPLEGSVALHAVDRRKIAYLPQRTDIDAAFPISVIDLVAMGLWHEIGPFGRLRPAHRALVDEAIAAVGLTGLERRPMGSLSGGQMQRTLFARLLLQDAALVLLDEPFAAVDASTQVDLLKLVGRWQAEGRTVLSVLHDHDTVRAHFPETLMLARDLVAHGPTEEVLTAENQFRARQMCEACAGPPHTCVRRVA
ncbi:MAG: zinc ABC transporter ATP-binding protein AztA [Pseudomonadota bacterium]